jgi:protein involved in polysaccharide export with SLBB domain
MRERLRTLSCLVAFGFAAPTLAQGMFDAGTLSSQGAQDQSQSVRQGGAASFPLRGGSEAAPESQLRAPVISNRFRPGASTAPGQPEPAQQPAQAEAQPRTEFQDFVLQATGRDVPIFGASLFRQVPSTFAPVDNIPVTPDYVIGPGDEILIRAWGQIDVDYSATVDRDGTVSVPKVGVINVAGIRSADLPGYLKTAFGRVFRNFQLTATLGKLRSIQIFVVGQARRPGTYTVSSLSTLVTALFAAGGPSGAGSMRNIQLKRGNQVVAELDLYDLLLSGDKSKDAHLLPGDVIYIPPVGALVAITGSVNVPAIYELRQRVPVFDLLRWAGGLTTTAQGQKVTLERIEDRKVRKVEEFSLDYGGLAHAVRDGDLLTIYPLVPRFDNAVTLRGNVAQPGRFAWREGMHVRDLIPDKEALLSRDYWIKRNQTAGIDENVARLLRDQENAGTQLGVGDFAEKAVRDERDLTIGETLRRRQIEQQADKLVPPAEKPAASAATGAAAASASASPADRPASRIVAAPSGKLAPESDPARLINQIKPPLNEVDWDYAVIERLRPGDLTTTLLPFNLGRAVLDADPQQNLPLEPGDIVTVFSKDDVRVPSAKQTKFVKLEGEFVASGVYEVQPGETLRRLVARVGGFAPDAYLFGAEFTRESTRAQQQKSLDETLNRFEHEVQARSVTRSQNVLSAEDAQSLVQQTASQQALIARLRQLKATGRIVLELPENAVLKDLPEVALENGDRFFVPSTPSMVSVFGSVYNQTSFVYSPEKRLADYLSQAGGPTRDADTGSVYLLRADGSVISRRNTGFILSSLDSARLMPGDAIVVPEELDHTTLVRGLKDWSQIFFQFGLGAAAIKVLQQ